MRIEKLKMEQLKPNEWNPNEMDEETFNRLAEEIETTGYIDPIQVVPMPDGTYRIIGGEHRFRVMDALGHDEMECVVLDDPKFQDEDLQRFLTTRLNAIRGKLNAEKFMELYNDLSERHAQEVLQSMMGFNEKEWDDLLKDARKGLKEAGASKEVLEKFDKVKREIKTVDDLSNILNALFKEFGATVDQNFMWFTYGGEKHLNVMCSPKLWKVVQNLMRTVEAGKLDASEVFYELLKGWELRVDVEVNDAGHGDEEGEGQASGGETGEVDKDQVS